MTNRKLHTRSRSVPKPTSTTNLDDLEWPLRIRFQNTCVFGARRRKEWRLTHTISDESV